MKKLFLLSILLISSMFFSQKRVGINTDSPQAALHVKADSGDAGFMLEDGNQATGKVLTSDASGKATWAAPSQSWFYLPSFDLPATGLGDYTFNLYNVYKQFIQTDNTKFKSSNPSLTTATNVALYTVDHLDFVVTDYDESAIKVNGIDPDGTMHYRVLTSPVPNGAFINILVRIK